MDNLFRTKNSDGMFAVALQHVTFIHVVFGKNTSDEPHNVTIFASGAQTEVKIHTPELEALLAAWNNALNR